MRSRETGFSYPSCERERVFRKYTLGMDIDAASKATLRVYRNGARIEVLPEDHILRGLFEQQRAKNGLDIQPGLRGYGAVNGVHLPFNPIAERMHRKFHLVP